MEKTAQMMILTDYGRWTRAAQRAERIRRGTVATLFGVAAASAWLLALLTTCEALKQ